MKMPNMLPNMKLSELKQFVEKLEADAQKRGWEDPEVEFATYSWGSPNPDAGLVDVKIDMFFFSDDSEKIYVEMDTRLR